MPDDSGKLTESEVARVWTWIISQTSDQPGLDFSACPLCKRMSVEVAEYLVEFEAVGRDVYYDLPPNSLGMPRRGIRRPPVYPSVQLLCTNCGYMQFLNAAVIGIVKERGNG